MAWIFLRIGVSADLVSMISILAFFSGGIALSLGSYVDGIIGAILVMFSCFLDTVDGHIARCKGPTHVGLFLESLHGTLLFPTVFVAIGFALWSNPGPYATLLSHLFRFITLDVGSFLLFLGMWAALMRTLRQLINSFLRTMVRLPALRENLSRKTMTWYSVLLARNIGTSLFPLLLMVLAVLNGLCLLAASYAIIETLRLVGATIVRVNILNE